MGIQFFKKNYMNENINIWYSKNMCKAQYSEIFKILSLLSPPALKTSPTYMTRSLTKSLLSLKDTHIFIINNSDSTDKNRHMGDHSPSQSVSIIIPKNQKNKMKE